MTIQSIFNFSPAVLPNQQPDRTTIALRSLLTGTVVAGVTLRLTHTLSLRLLAPLTASLFTFCFETWRAQRVEPKAPEVPNDLEGQNALCSTLIDAAPELWVDIWKQMCLLPNLIVKENALLAKTMEKVFSDTIEEGRAAHLLEPFLQENEPLIAYLQTHDLLMKKAIPIAKGRIGTAIQTQDPSTTRKLLREPFMSEFLTMEGFQFDCWVNVRDAKTAKVLKETNIDPNQSHGQVTPLHYIAQNPLVYSAEFKACDHASALIEAGASDIEEAMLLCRDNDYLAGWLASYCFHEHNYKAFVNFYVNMNKSNVEGFLDRSSQLDDDTIRSHSEKLWTMCWKFNCPSEGENSVFMRLLRLNKGKLHDWLAQAVFQNCPEVVEALFKSKLLNVPNLQKWIKSYCWLNVKDIKTARLLQANGLNVNEDQELIQKITQADTLRLVLACGRNVGITDAINTWNEPHRDPLVTILLASRFWHAFDDKSFDVDTATLEIYKELCLLSEYETDAAILEKTPNCLRLICKFDDATSSLFKRIVNSATNSQIVEILKTVSQSTPLNVVSALLKSGKIRLNDLSAQQKKDVGSAALDRETTRILIEQGFKLE